MDKTSLFSEIYRIASRNKIIFFTFYYSLLFWNYSFHTELTYLSSQITSIIGFLIDYNDPILFLGIVGMFIGTLIRTLVFSFINFEEQKIVDLLVTASILENICITLILIILPFAYFYNKTFIIYFPKILEIIIGVVLLKMVVKYIKRKFSQL